MNRFYILLIFLSFSISCSKIPDVEPEIDLIFSPYPNPTGDQVVIYIKNDELMAYLIQVFDTKGDLMFTENVAAGDPRSSFMLDLREKPKGSYQVILKKNSVVYTKKFLKI